MILVLLNVLLLRKTVLRSTACAPEARPEAHDVNVRQHAVIM
jgi:hypothetical protein